MKRKFTFFGICVLICTLMISLGSCQKDYSDDIDDLQRQIDENKTAVAALNQAIASGKLIKTVASLSDGYLITFSDNTTITINHGATGATGATGAAGATGTVITMIDATTAHLSTPFGGTVFSGRINGTPSATSVNFDGGNEGVFPDGRIILYNTTKGNSRIATVGSDGVSGTITTLSSTDNWANDDYIRIFSSAIGSSYDDYYCDVDVSDVVAVSATWILVHANMSIAIPDTCAVRVHPFETRNSIKETVIDLYGSDGPVTFTTDAWIKNVNRKICVRVKGDSTNVDISIKGYMV